jgi:hypothetical protein
MAGSDPALTAPGSTIHAPTHSAGRGRGRLRRTRLNRVLHAAGPSAPATPASNALRSAGRICGLIEGNLSRGDWGTSRPAQVRRSCCAPRARADDPPVLSSMPADSSRLVDLRRKGVARAISRLWQGADAMAHRAPQSERGGRRGGGGGGREQLLGPAGLAGAGRGRWKRKLRHHPRSPHIRAPKAGWHHRRPFAAATQHDPTGRARARTAQSRPYPAKFAVTSLAGVGVVGHAGARPGKPSTPHIVASSTIRRDDPGHE